MKKLIFITLCFTSILFAQNQQLDLENLYEKAYFLETAQRDLQKSFTVYEAVLALNPEDDLAARCHLRIAEIYRKTNKNKQAKLTYQKILKNFAQQKEICQQVQKKLKEYYGAADSSASLLDKIKTTTITVDFKEAPLEDFIRFLAKTADINILVVEGMQIPITLKVKKVSVKALLDILPSITGVSYKVWNGIIIIGNLPVEWRIDSTSDSVPATTKEKEDYLQNNLLNVDFLETPSQDFFNFFAKTLDLNIVLTKEAQGKKINLSLRNVSAKNILQIACSLIDCRYHYQNSIIVIDHEDKYRSTSNEIYELPLQFTYDHPPVENQKFTVIITHKDPQSKITESDRYALQKKENNQYTMRLQFTAPFDISVQHPGYYPQKKFVKKLAKTVFAMQAKKRQLSFHIHNSKTKKMVLAKAVMVNAKQASFNDRYSPGQKLQVEIKCQGYKPFTTTVTVVPGKGPFIIDVPVVAE
ncbi:tetratricopeptide repeat protein [Candidatus Uabimicrobium amorphum]|uniref:Secretin/TonB short N-terminal domain-containing protein n=1 Tax=Uabimicrobium amorphum TaxID=2596890 RepID=A0A5S9ITE1_UABAM|nr:tetratricopeptide repeat protein [Candidatus Uabimicrobium amorphum]BBM87803.1 hypothetical protein UABAM_06218 [Candidatus Uabimicrobium amorphum]